MAPGPSQAMRRSPCKSSPVHPDCPLGKEFYLRTLNCVTCWHECTPVPLILGQISGWWLPVRDVVQTTSRLLSPLTLCSILVDCWEKVEPSRLITHEESVSSLKGPLPQMLSLEGFAFFGSPNFPKIFLTYSLCLSYLNCYRSDLQRVKLRPIDENHLPSVTNLIEYKWLGWHQMRCKA